MTDTSDSEVLYHRLIAGWNQRDAEAMASCFGPAAIRDHLAPIFEAHPTATFVVELRERRVLAPGVTLLRAIAGMVPPGTVDLNPAVNAVQTLVATLHGDTWQVELFQNTPAAYHGRPEEQEAHTEALRAVLRTNPLV
jgi:uncharacterized protein (TIGR02246 family)